MAMLNNQGVLFSWLCGTPGSDVQREPPPDIGTRPIRYPRSHADLPDIAISPGLWGNHQITFLQYIYIYICHIYIYKYYIYIYMYYIYICNIIYIWCSVGHPPSPPTNGYGWTVSSGSSGPPPVACGGGMVLLVPPPCGLWWWYGSSGPPPCGLWWWYVGMLVCWYVGMYAGMYVCMYECMYVCMECKVR